MGRRVAIVGVGNVMVDIANYCVHFCDCDAVVAIARRGPYEKAYDDREFEDIEDAFDRDLYRQEIARIRPRLEAAGQDVDDLLRALGQRPEAETRTRARLSFRFLASPRRVLAEGGPRGRARGRGDAARAEGRPRRGGGNGRDQCRCPATPWCSRWATASTPRRVFPTRTACT